jgi:hypothetical protein
MNMVDFTTASIFQYVYFISQKDNLFAIAYFRVACYSINWIHNLRVILYKVMFISYHSNMSEKQDIYFSFLFFYHFFRILSRIFEFSKIRHLNIKQKSFLYNEWKFERRK